MPISTSTPSHRLNDKLIILWGSPKFGKSSLAAQIPNAIFLATERGLDNLAVTRWEAPDGRYVIQSWNELLQATDEAIKAGAKTIVIDTLGNACWLAERHICEKFSENYISDGKLGYGKGSRIVINEVKRYLTKLSSLNIGVVLIAHATTKTVQTRTGDLVRQVPMIPGDNKREEMYNLILASADIIGFVDQERVQRGNAVETRPILRLKPDPTYEAGDRSGRLPPCMPMDWVALERAYEQAGAAAAKKTTAGQGSDGAEPA